MRVCEREREREMAQLKCLRERQPGERRKEGGRERERERGSWLNSIVCERVTISTTGEREGEGGMERERERERESWLNLIVCERVTTWRRREGGGEREREREREGGIGREGEGGRDREREKPIELAKLKCL